ncbi:hypothetical protein GCM10009638_22080 [Luteococcus sanguinis]
MRLRGSGFAWLSRIPAKIAAPECFGPSAGPDCSEAAILAQKPGLFRSRWPEGTLDGLGIVRGAGPGMVRGEARGSTIAAYLII